MTIARSLPALLILFLSVPGTVQGEDVDLHAIYTPLRTFRVAAGYEIELAVDLTNYGLTHLNVTATFLGTEELATSWHVPIGGRVDLDAGETRRLVQLVRVPEAELRRWQHEDVLPRLRVAYDTDTSRGVTTIELVPPAQTERAPSRH